MARFGSYFWLAGEEILTGACHGEFGGSLVICCEEAGKQKGEGMGVEGWLI